MTARYLSRAVGDQARYDATRIGKQWTRAEVNSWVCGMQIRINSIDKDPMNDSFVFSVTKGSSGDHGMWDVFTLTAKQLLQLIKNDRVSLLNLYLEQGRCKKNDEE